MKRDMELVRLVLLAIEDEYRSTAIANLKIDGYDFETVAYHCKILDEAGFVSGYRAQYGSDCLYAFSVGPLTWEGNEFLDRIRDDSIWEKTKSAIKDNGLPLVVETVKTVAYTIVTAMSEGITTAVINSMK